MTLFETQLAMFVSFLVNYRHWTIEDAKFEARLVKKSAEQGTDYEKPEFYIRMNRKGSKKRMNREDKISIDLTFQKALEHGYYNWAVANNKPI